MTDRKPLNDEDRSEFERLRRIYQDQQEYAYGILIGAVISIPIVIWLVAIAP